MTEQTPYIDFENLPTPSGDFLVTPFITVQCCSVPSLLYRGSRGQVVLEENHAWLSSPTRG